MEYIYAAMLLHKAGQKIDEGSVKKVLESASIKADDTRIRALIAALEGVNIDEAIKTAAIAPAAATAAPAEAKKEEKKKEEEKPSAEEAAAGLGALFG
ncbi:MAG TPA: 50S ribosomal protein P1 [Candidatus Nanoarchaeia archaeon]|nr:50S ribosomal protein P1 [Candidatus Nanoarchaeia archaeon]